jgi:hypothetical protein
MYACDRAEAEGGYGCDNVAQEACKGTGLAYGGKTWRERAEGRERVEAKRSDENAKKRSEEKEARGEGDGRVGAALLEEFQRGVRGAEITK